MNYTGGTPEADHLCVLVHGKEEFPTAYENALAQLWGNPHQMRNVAKALRSRYPADELYLLVAKRNSGNSTSDGIELGGERVCAEIEEELRAIRDRGGRISKLSLVGYSLGGLVARYAVGLLYAKGVLDDLECMNFTTFASPHLGVRTPLKGWHNHIWNVMGARTLSMSGRQLFTVDHFRDTGRPLLAVMADPKSIFMSGLSRFERRTLYTNITNDKSAPYYTTCISRTDPFADLSGLEVGFVDGYEDVILDSNKPLRSRSKRRGSVGPAQALAAVGRLLWRVPLGLVKTVIVVLGLVVHLMSSVYWNVTSSRRIKLHEKGLAGVPVEEYRLPLWIREAQAEAERAYEALNNTTENEYLDSGNAEEEVEQEEEGGSEGSLSGLSPVRTRERGLSSVSNPPTLALTAKQFAMIESLDNLGWRKYPVWIHKDKRSHRAIIARLDRPSHAEGWVVFSHWLNEEFLV